MWPSHNIWTLHAPMFSCNFPSILYLLIIQFYEKISIGLLANLALVWICCSYHVGENSKISQFPALFLEKTKKKQFCDLHIKSVHFKNPLARSSFLSKSLSLLFFTLGKHFWPECNCFNNGPSELLSTNCGLLTVPDFFFFFYTMHFSTSIWWAFASRMRSF